MKAWKAYRKEWNDKAQVWKSRPKHDWSSHDADCLRYLSQAWGLYQTTPSVDIVKPFMYRTRHTAAEAGGWML